MKKLIAIFIILATLFLASCQSAAPVPTSIPEPTIAPTVDLCPQDELLSAKDKLSELQSRWSDEFKIIASKDKLSEDDIRSLQQIKREWNAQKVPVCLEKAKSLFSNSMTDAIDGLLASIAKKPNSVILPKLDSAGDYAELYFEEFQKVTSGDFSSESYTLEKSLFDEKQPGIYLVNVDIAPGIWRNNGTSDECYWEITTESGDVIDNHMGMSGGTANIPATAFQVTFEKECGTWTFLK